MSRRRVQNHKPQSGSCTLRPPRLLLRCFPLRRRQISSDVPSSPLSSAATKTQTSKGLLYSVATEQVAVQFRQLYCVPLCPNQSINRQQNHNPNQPNPVEFNPPDWACSSYSLAGLVSVLGVNSFLKSSQFAGAHAPDRNCLLYTSPSPRDQRGSRMPSSA